MSHGRCDRREVQATLVHPTDHGSVTDGPSARAHLVEACRLCDRRSSIAFVVYLLLSIGFLGRTLIAHSGYYEGRGPDPSAFIWSVAWWRYAVTHCLNPFLTRVIFVPDGANLAWITTVPLASLVAWPITAANGPVAAYNTLALSGPAVAAWTTFVLCRYLTNSVWPALLAGYIFGFSSYVLAQTVGGHINLALIFSVPITLYLTARWFDGSIDSRRMAGLMSITLAIQFYLSIEIFTTMTMFAGLALALALGATAGAIRQRLLRLIGVLALAYGVALLLASPYVYYLFAYGQPHGEIWDTRQFSADLLNFLIPTEVNGLGALKSLRKVSIGFPGNIFERTAYFGPILIGVTIAYGWGHRKEAFARVLMDLFLVIGVLSLGPTMHLGGRELMGMPGKGLAVMPVINKALPVRFTMYAMLITAIIMSLWLVTNTVSLRTRLVVAALAVVFSLPNLQAGFWVRKVDTPAFFSTGLYRKYITPNENVLITPYWLLGNSMLWQAQTGMYFRQAGGWTGPLPDEYRRWPLIGALTEWTYLPNPHTQVMSFLAKHGVTAVVVSNDDPNRAVWLRWLEGSVVAPIEIGGVTLYRISPSVLIPYRAIGALEAERQADSALFAALFAAGLRYNADGGKPERLTPGAAEDLGLIPSDWVPGKVWVPDWMAGTRFDTTLDRDQPVYRGIWLGYVYGRFMGVGISGTYEGLRPVIERYQPFAYRTYFPYPQQFTRRSQESGRGFLLMFFDADGLKRATAAIPRPERKCRALMG
jgi:hypothetical protein